MADRLTFVRGRGSLDLAKTFTVKPTAPPPEAGGTLPTLFSKNADGYGVANPIAVTDMRDWINRSYGGATNYAFTSVVQVADGPLGGSTKVIDQYLKAGTYGMPGGSGSGTGIALTSIPLGVSWEEATIEYYVRFVGSGTWPLGCKLPGLAGILPGQGGVPTGGDPSIYGWSGRDMQRRNNAAPTVSSHWRGYIYDPSQPANAYGQDRDTGQLFTWGTWVKVKKYYRMNTVVTDGASSPPADGVHRMFWNDSLVYENLAQVYRRWKLARATHLCWDNFAGGNDSTFAVPSDVHVQFDNLVVAGA